MTKRAFSTFEQRVGWLLAHHQFLVGKVADNKQKIVTAMKLDGLVSRKTYWPDVGLKDEIREAKIHWFAQHNR
jgi:hypothetical protein